ncbi:MAG: bifunctional nuclease family protein [Puniceicoccaceae bacterium]
MKDDVLPIQVKGVMPTTSGCAVFLGNEEKVFVIYVDPGIGNTISMTINDVKKERPMTHDLIGSIFQGFGIQLQRMVINDVDEGTYYARLILRMENEVDTKLVEIDARPSDSLVLALQQKKPIFVAREVFEKVDDMTEILQKITNQEGGAE